MLTLKLLREQPDFVIERLAVKNFDAAQTVKDILEADSQRRATQTMLDSVLAQQNAKAKEIGMLMKQGKKEEAEEVKKLVASLKEQSKELEVKMEEYTNHGEDYLAVVKEAFENRWIDVHETPTKRSGAYSMGVPGCHPFMLLNYQKTTHDIFTIAHEMGHSMHSYYSQKAQPYSKAGYKIFVAEVASTCNEVLLLKHLLATEKDVNVCKYLLQYYLEPRNEPCCTGHGRPTTPISSIRWC